MFRITGITVQDPGIRVHDPGIGVHDGSESVFRMVRNTQLSQAFFGRGWPEYELDGLVTRTVSGDQVLLPVWHNVTKREVMDYSPSLADRVARSTGTHTVEEIAAEIVDVIRNAPEG